MGHPVLSQRSLMMLSDMIPLVTCQRLMIGLGFSTDKISKIKEEADRKNLPEVFLLLLTWYQGVKGLKEDADLIKDIEVSFRDIGRRDIALKIANARKEHREIDNRDTND